MRRPTCNCINDESDQNKELVSLWNSVNVAEVKTTYGTKMVWLPVKFCPLCGYPYVEYEIGIDLSTQNDFTGNVQCGSFHEKCLNDMEGT